MMMEVSVEATARIVYSGFTILQSVNLLTFLEGHDKQRPVADEGARGRSDDMLCPRCGEANAFGAKFCVQCGSSLPSGAEAPDPAPSPTPRAVTGAVLGLAMPRTLEPLAGPPAIGPAENSGKAIASLICGLFMWIFPAAAAAIILGHVSLSEIGRSAGKLKGRGMAISGLVLGYAGLFLIPLILIIAAIAIPNLLRAREAANEASAVGSLRTIDIAAIRYSAAYANGFPPTLISLDGTRDAAPRCDHAQLIDSALASGQSNGYTFTYVPTGTQILRKDAKARGCTIPGSSSFEVHADPIARGTTGQRSFFTDQTGVIRVDENAPASSESVPIE
jgi:type IV pilus assembly protein PilA